jgi:hypothetical protein
MEKVGIHSISEQTPTHVSIPTCHNYQDTSTCDLILRKFWLKRVRFIFHSMYVESSSHNKFRMYKSWKAHTMDSMNALVPFLSLFIRRWGTHHLHDHHHMHSTVRYPTMQYLVRGDCSVLDVSVILWLERIMKLFVCTIESAIEYVANTSVIRFHWNSYCSS